jgi:hypothetical protein
MPEQFERAPAGGGALRLRTLGRGLPAEDIVRAYGIAMCESRPGRIYPTRRLRTTDRDLRQRTGLRPREQSLPQNPNLDWRSCNHHWPTLSIPLCLQPTFPAGFIAPCLPTKTDKLPAGDLWLHDIKHDGFPIIARKSNGRVRLYSPRRNYNVFYKDSRVSLLRAIANQ